MAHLELPDKTHKILKAIQNYQEINEDNSQNLGEVVHDLAESSEYMDKIHLEVK